MAGYLLWERAANHTATKAPTKTELGEGELESASAMDGGQQGYVLSEGEACEYYFSVYISSHLYHTFYSIHLNLLHYISYLCILYIRRENHTYQQKDYTTIIFTIHSAISSQEAQYIMAATANLTSRDSAILSSLFTNEPPQILIPRPAPALNSKLQSIKRAEAAAIAPLAKGEPSKDVIEQAIAALDKILDEHKEYASAYNNRAQAQRLLLGDDLTKEGTGKIWEDLKTCISLAKSLPEDQRDEKLLGAGYTQRGVLLLATAKSLKTLDNQESRANLPDDLKTLGNEASPDGEASEMEKEAEGAFKEGAKYGDEAAKMMVVHLNPMRKLCGQMVREALRRDMEESGVFQNRPKDNGEA